MNSNILLIGNPNTGKTTLFNALTNKQERTGNWNGVTSNFIVGTLRHKDKKFNVVDLPGVYSLTPLSGEEKVTVDFLFKDKKKSLCVNVCEASAIEKNLFLTLEVLEYGSQTILVINNKNKKSQNAIDTKKLSQILKVPVFIVDFENKKEIESLKEFLANYKSTQQNFVPSYYTSIVSQHKNLFEIAKNFNEFTPNFFVAKTLCGDEFFLKMANIIAEDKLEQICLSRHVFIKNLDIISKKTQKNMFFYEKIDRFLLNKYFAIPVFFCVMLVIFYLTFFSVGKFLSDGLEFLATNYVANNIVTFLKSYIQTEFLISFFENAIFGGFLIVLKFLPQVCLLFFFLNLIEQSGYLSRVAFAFEDILSKFGLNGKSVYTILLGFGCTVPAIMTSSTNANKSSKIKTALLTPFMSCSAKIPVYVVLGGVFFGRFNIFVIMILYMLGLIVGFAMSYIYEKTILKTKSTNFVFELTNLCSVSFKKIFDSVAKSIWEFVKRIFVVVLCSNIVIWVLSNFSFSLNFVPVSNSQNFFSKSVLQVLSEFLLPVFAFIGLSSWTHVGALICGLIAKEVVVSSLALFGGGNLKGLEDVGSAIYFSPSSALAFLVFVLLYPPCVASLSMLKQEIGLKWTIFSTLVQITLAFVFAYIAFKLYPYFIFAPLELFLFGIMLFLFATSLYLIIFKPKKVACNKL